MGRSIHFFGSALVSLAAFSLGAPRATQADDDVKLKDGTKITGTIVGFEDNSFKVKTSYGFALVEKDQVVSIIVRPAPKPAADKPAGKPAEDAASKPLAAPPPSKSAPAPPVVTGKPSGSSVSPPPAAAAATPPAAESVAAKPPAPESIREQVTGNSYTNQTYQFRMYKPPDWDVIASAPAVLPGAITAMGTPDDSTYLLIGQEPLGRSLAAEMEATESRLRSVMENFRSVGANQITISGTTALEHRFRGSVDQHDWSGMVVLVVRGTKLYTIFGMTRADNDLVQLQENVISRAISSLEFTN